MTHYPACYLPREINITALVSAFRIQREQNFYFSGETHDFYELVYVIKGKAGITADDRIYILEEGQCILHPPMEFHKIWSEDSSSPELIILSFHAKQMPNNIGGRYCLSPDLRMTLEDWMEEHPSVFFQDDFLVKQIKDRSGARRQLCKLELFLAELFTASPDLEQTESGNAAVYTEIVRIMKQNINRMLTIDELSSQCHMSKSSLKRIFSHYSGIGIITYFNRLKISKACELLIQGESVGNIAELLGFSDQNYFSTVFRRHVGLSPSAYLKQQAH